jgi:hypothetical protein
MNGISAFWKHTKEHEGKSVDERLREVIYGAALWTPHIEEVQKKAGRKTIRPNWKSHTRIIETTIAGFNWEDVIPWKL